MQPKDHIMDTDGLLPVYLLNGVMSLGRDECGEMFFMREACLS